MEVAGEPKARAPLSRWAIRISLWVLAGAFCAIAPNGRALASLAPHSSASVVAAPTGPPVKIEPINGSTNVMPSTMVTVTSQQAIQKVTVTDNTGANVDGRTDINARVWRSAVALMPGRQYQVSVDTHHGNKPLSTTTSFSTVPGRLVSASVLPTDGTTVGVGMPVVVRFSAPVKNQAEILKGITVASSSGLEVRAHWFNAYELHFRPAAYWPEGVRVTATLKLDGLDAGDNIFGAGSQQVHFTVGDARISTVDVLTHTMTVTQNGQVVRTMPISAGRPKYPTMNGVHFVWGRAKTLIMNSATVGIPKGSPDYYYEKVNWNVQITTGGEYVHSAPWSVSKQGEDNVSHGCVNASPADAQWFFGFSRLGDIVQVTGSPRAPTAQDGSADWNTPFTEWLPEPTPVAPALTAPATRNVA